MLSRVIATGIPDRSFTVYLFRGELFASCKTLAASLLLSDSGFRGLLHRLETQSAPNKPLRKALALKVIDGG
jgi:hypothetical protein